MVFLYFCSQTNLNMVEIGRMNRLKAVKMVDFGMYLDGGEGGYVPVGGKVGDELDVFIYQDNQGRLIATTDTPLAQVGEFRFLKVKAVNQVGAFLEWGIMKDLLVPFKEQKVQMREGKYYLVYVHLDHVSKRIVASARIDKYLNNVMPDYAVSAFGKRGTAERVCQGDSGRRQN